MKTVFEEMNGSYTVQGDYLLPNLQLDENESATIGVWGQRHRRYLKEHHRVLYTNLLTSGKLNEYLADVDERCALLFSRLVKDLAEKEGVTERLKADDPIAWIRRMNSIRNRAMEMVLKEVVFV